jgi:hypothetical protein
MTAANQTFGKRCMAVVNRSNPASIIASAVLIPQCVRITSASYREAEPGVSLPRRKTQRPLIFPGSGMGVDCGGIVLHQYFQAMKPCRIRNFI